MKAKCRKCGDTVEVTRPREFKSCMCGAINLDYGDGFYYRVGGNPEDFDGEIEAVPELNDDLVYRPRAIKADNSMERVMDIIGEENIGGESRPLRAVNHEQDLLYMVVKDLSDRGLLRRDTIEKAKKVYEHSNKKEVKNGTGNV